MREPIDLPKSGILKRKAAKDKMIREKYPNAEIMTLIAEEKLTKAEKTMDALVWLTTPLMGVFSLAKGLNNLDNEFYLVNDGSKQYLVMVTNEFIESRELSEHIADKKFEIGNYKFTNCGPIIHG